MMKGRLSALVMILGGVTFLFAAAKAMRRWIPSMSLSILAPLGPAQRFNSQ